MVLYGLAVRKMAAGGEAEFIARGVVIGEGAGVQVAGGVLGQEVHSLLPLATMKELYSFYPPSSL